MRKYTKEEAIRIVVSCAEKYRAELLDRSLLFICVDKQRSITAVETAFFDRNYLHLTGLKLHKEPPISAADFFRRCAANRLSPSDFAFSEDGTTHLKLEVLPRGCQRQCRRLSPNYCGVSQKAGRAQVWGADVPHQKQEG